MLHRDRRMGVLSKLTRELDSAGRDGSLHRVSLGASPKERTSGRRGYRNARYKRKLDTRVGMFYLKVLPD